FLPPAEWETSSWLLASLATNAIHSLLSNTASAGAALLDWFCTWVLGPQDWPSAEWLTSSWLLASLATNPSVKPCGPELTKEKAGARLLDSFPTWVLGCQFLPLPEWLASNLFVSLFATKARYMLMVIPLPNPRHPRDETSPAQGGTTKFEPDRSRRQARSRQWISDRNAPAPP